MGRAAPSRRCMPIRRARMRAGLKPVLMRDGVGRDTTLFLPPSRRETTPRGFLRRRATNSATAPHRLALSPSRSQWKAMSANRRGLTAVPQTARVPSTCPAVPAPSRSLREAARAPDRVHDRFLLLSLRAPEPQRRRVTSSQRRSAHAPRPARTRHTRAAAVARRTGRSRARRRVIKAGSSARKRWESR